MALTPFYGKTYLYLYHVVNISFSYCSAINNTKRLFVRQSNKNKEVFKVLYIQYYSSADIDLNYRKLAQNWAISGIENRD